MNIVRAIGSEEQLDLRRAVLIYETRGYGEGSALATVHDVVPAKKGPPVLGPGRCLSRETLDEMTRKMSGLPRRREILPPHVLLADGGLMVWHVPARRCPIFFQTRDKRFTAALSGRQVLHPPLLFLAKPGNLWVWALASGERPTAATPLYRAPYLNVYDEAHVCRGNAAFPVVLSVADLPAWERAWYETNFTHSNTNRLTLHPRGHAGLWWYLSQERLREFPVRYLVPLNVTVGEVVNR